MSAKRQLLCASALCGSLFIVSTPAWADCTTTAGAVVCADAVADGTVLPDDTASFLNNGTIMGATTSAVAGGTNIGDFTNAGTITVSSAGNHHAIDIAGLQADATLTNRGLIQGGTGTSDAIRIAGSARVDNHAAIEVRNAGRAAVRVGDASRVENRAGATIRGMADPDNFGILTGASSTVVNGGMIQNVGNGIEVGVDSVVENNGTIEARHYGVDGSLRTQLTNGQSGIIRADRENAVELGAGSVFINHGLVEAFDENSDDSSVVDVADSVILNEATGVISITPDSPDDVVTAISAHGSSIRNAGLIRGDIWSANELFNGVTSGGMPIAGPSRIDGKIAMSDNDDFLQNAGVINGDIKLGKGEDGLRNSRGGVITGNIDLGSDEETPDPVEGDETPPRNFLTNAGTITGAVIGGEGVDEVELDGVHNGDINLAGGDDLLKFSGTLNGNALMGAGDDMVIVFDRPLLEAGGRIDAEGGDADHLVFNGDSGSWSSDQFGNFEKLTKLGGGRTVLKETWTGFSEIRVTDGTLVVDGGDNDGLAGALTASNSGVYLLNGVHYGDITLEEGGTLAGNGENSAQGVDAVQVRNLSGVVSPGDGGIGTLTFVNDYYQGALGRLDIELGAPGQSDLLIIGGTAHLDGTVRFIPLDLADTGPYVFMQYNAVTGQFAKVEGADGRPGLFYTYSVDYRPNQAVVNVVKTGTAPVDPEPQPTGACTPAPAPSGSTVVCVPTITAPEIFTTHDLDIRVNGLLTLNAASPVIRTTGSNIKLTVAADGGVVNTGDGEALGMEGESNHLINLGVIRSDKSGRQRHVGVRAGLGKTSIVLNGASGVIGAETDFEAIALQAEGGRFNIANDGLIFGDVIVSGEGLELVNGRIGDNGALKGASLIRGNVQGTQSRDDITNRGRIEGNINTLDGHDRIDNLEGGVIMGNLDTGAGDDNLLAQGLLTGDVLMGDGADVLELQGRIDGDIRMGAGDDQMWIANIASPGAPAAFDMDHKIDGGDGLDRLNFSGANGSWDASQFAGFEMLRKEGGGLTTLTGVWDHLDSTQTGEVASGVLQLAQGAEMHSGLKVLNSGQYRIDGAHLAQVSVEQGGLVSGSGSIGNSARFAAGNLAVLSNDGVVAPGGNGLGTLTVWGNYSQGASGRLDVELGLNGQSDVLDVRGQAVLNGAVQFVPLDVGVTGAYTFLKAGGITGNFAAVNPDADRSRGLFFSYALDYSTVGQVSVNVTKTGEPVDPDPVDPDPVDPEPTDPDVLDVVSGLTKNQQAVRDAFMADGAFTSDLAKVRAELNHISLEKAPRALDSFSGEIYAASPQMAGRAAKRFARAIDDQLSAERLGLQGPSGGGAVLWSQILAETGHQQSDRTRSGYDLDLIGAAVGADVQLSSGLRAGLAMGRTDADADQRRLSAEAKITTNHLGAYGSANLGGVYVDAQTSYAWHEIDATRALIVSDALTRRAKGDVEAQEVRAAVKVGYAFDALEATWRPYGSLAFDRVEQDGFVETGAGDAGLKVGTVTQETTTAAVGADVSWSVGSLRPYAGLGVSHDLSSDDGAAGARLIGGSAGAVFTVRGSQPGDTAVLGRFGLGGTLGAVEVNAGYDVEARDRYLAHSLTLGARIRW